MTLEAKGLTFGYRKGQTTIRDVDLELRPGRVCAIVGPNGAGKSTLLRLLAGLHRPRTGRALLDGVPVARVSARKRAARVALISQRATVASDFSVREVVEIGRFAVGASSAAVDRALEAMGLMDLAAERFSTLSQGQQQRVSIARAVGQLTDGGGGVRAGATLLADEPLASLDPRHGAGTLGLFRELADRGAAVCFAAHDLTAARRAADDAMLLDEDGCVHASGEAANVIEPGGLGRVFRTAFVVIGEGGSAIVAQQNESSEGDPRKV